MNYAQFLAGKRRSAPSVGPDVSPSDVNPILHDWQAEIVAWAARQGRAALFEDCGLGKTFQSLEWARLTAETSLILAPLSVARQTVREGAKLGIDVQYVRSGDQVTGPGVWITNYEMASKFDPAGFGAVVLDEASILKNVEGRTRRQLTAALAVVPYRLSCTATPAPNDVTELCNQAEFLGVMARSEMLAAFFVHDEIGWRLKGHAAGPMFEWLASWACALRRPSDIGWPDDGYALPELRVHGVIVDVDVKAEGQLFATDLGGVGGRAKVRKATLTARCERAVELCSRPGQWIAWCGLNDEAASIAATLDGAVNVDGAMAPERKAELLEAFQDGEIRVLVTKPSIAGFGMNFQQCHQMVFVGLGDSYEAYYQAVRRCWRFGQTHQVDAHVIVSRLEQQIVTNVRRKEAEAADATAQLVAYNPVRRTNAQDGGPAALRYRRVERRMLATTTRR